MEIVTRLLLKTNQFDANLKGAKKSVNSFTSELSSITSKALPGIAAFTGISLAVGDAVRTTMEFEKSLSSLKALTGVSTQELSFFKEEAIRLGSTTTQTAAQVVDAYKLIGSQMPELLKNKEALSRVTEQAIVLAEAAELDVPTAAKALTGSLNQMGESSMHASEYINILAAASQQGSADIPYLNKAIEGAGGTASSVGVKFNELVAAIEAIAPKITDAGSAGTNLRNIFLSLEGSTDKNLKPSVVGFSEALENLAKKQMDVTELTKMFGKESVTAALAIINSKDKYLALADSITGTNTAYEQQATNTDNLSGAVDKLKSAWDGLTVSIMSSSGALTTLTKSATNSIIAIKNLFKEADTLGDWINNAVAKANAKVDVKVKLSGKPEEQAIREVMRELDKEYPTRGTDESSQEIYQAAMVNLKSRLDALAEAKKKAEEDKVKAEEASKKAQETARKEEEKAREKAKQAEAKRKEKIFKQNEVSWNAEGWAKQEALGGTQFKQPLEQPLKITPLPITIDEIADEALPKTDLEIKLKAKLENYEFAKKKIEELKALSEVATTPEEKKQIKGQIGEWEKFGGVVDKKDTKQNNEYAESLQNIGGAMGNITGLFDDSAASVLQWGANFATTIAQAAMSLSSLIPVKELDTQTTKENTAAEVGNASIKAIEAHAGIPFVGVALGIAAVASIIAAMASVPKFEHGGIVGGTSFSGDKILARINSGEMILNQGQQGNLFNLLNSGGSGVETRIAVDNIVIKGSDMHLALKTYQKRQNKI